MGSGGMIVNLMARYSLEFYQDVDGTKPALVFMRSLDLPKRRAIGTGIRIALQELGGDVAEGNWGRNLGGGLYEFKVDQTAEQILRRVGEPAEKEPKIRLVLRLFFHVYGDKILLLLAGYDKGEHPTAGFQQKEIEGARSLLRRWKRGKRGTLTV